MTVAQEVAAQDFPDRLLRVALRRAGRKKVNRDIVGEFEFLGGMPAGLIHEHQDMLVEMALGNFRQKNPHHLRVASRQNQ